MKEAMQFYAKLGLPVIPLCPYDHKGMSDRHRERCTRPGKHPLIKDWQYRGKPTQIEIEQWFKNWPHLNIGLVLGRPSGIVGIDVDGDGGHKLLQEMSGGNLPPTWTFSTPNNGMRYLYRIPGNKVLKKTGVTDTSQAHTECALLGENCQTVLPPSIHSNGGRYHWITGPTVDQSDIATAPKWLIERMDRSSPTAHIPPVPSVFERLATYCEVFADNWEDQQGPGLDEENWFRWVSMLTHSSGIEHAREFSKASPKHGLHSEERLRNLDRSGQKGLVRCTTFGCSEAKIRRCFTGNVRTNDSGEITNSPGSLLSQSLPPPSSAGQGLQDSLEQIGLHISSKTGKLISINGNVYVRYLLRSKLDLLFSNDRYYQYEGGVWLHKDSNAIERILREILHSFVPDSWNHTLQSSYLSTLRVEAPRVDKMDHDRTLINLSNGMLDLRTYELKRHDKKYHSTIQVPIRYDPTADCPTFRKYLNDVFEGDAELIRLVAEMLGYCLTAEMKAQKAFILYGKGSNGKSVLADILVKLVGAQNVSSVSLGELESSFARLDLVDKLLNLSTENEVGSAGLNTGYFKKIVSGDDIRVEIKGGASFSYKPFCKQVFAVNNLPYSKDKSHGYLRRLQIIPFNKIFSGKEVNVHLLEELIDELPGILNFALEGLKRLVANGYTFTKAKASSSILREYQEELNPVETFVEEMIVKGQPTDRVKNKTIGDIFRLWCQENGHSSLSQYTQVRLLRMIREILRAKGILMMKGNAGDGRYQTGIQINRSPESFLNENVTVTGGEIDDIEDIAN